MRGSRDVTDVQNADFCEIKGRRFTSFLTV